jgi:hypothetical protein
MNSTIPQPTYNSLIFLNGKSVDTSHGSAFDRGCADAYYGRLAKPHKKPRTSHFYLLSSSETLEYYHGYMTEKDRKDWGMEY